MNAAWTLRALSLAILPAMSVLTSCQRDSAIAGPPLAPDVQSMAESSYPLDRLSHFQLTVPLQRLKGAGPYHSQLGRDGVRVVFSAITFEFPIIEWDSFGDAEEASETIAHMANQWMDDQEQALRHYYPIPVNPSASVWVHASPGNRDDLVVQDGGPYLDWRGPWGRPSEQLVPQNAPLNVQLLESWNSDPDRPKASSLYLHHHRESFHVFQ